MSHRYSNYKPLALLGGDNNRIIKAKVDITIGHWWWKFTAYSVPVFKYPNSSWHYYNMEHLPCVNDAGIDTAELNYLLREEK